MATKDLKILFIINLTEPLKFEVDQTEVHSHSYMDIPCRQ